MAGISREGIKSLSKAAEIIGKARVPEEGEQKDEKECERVARDSKKCADSSTDRLLGM